MAITWSSWRSGGGNKYRMGVDVTWSPAVPSPSTTSVTVTTRLYLQSEFASNGGSDSWWLKSSRTIDASNVGGWSWTTSAMQQLLVATRTESVNISFAGPHSYSATGRGKDLGASTLDISVTKNVSIPQRPMDSPAPVSALTVTRVSDTRQNLAWTNNPGSTAPYHSVEVSRIDSTTGSYSTVASLSGTPTSFADTSTRGARNYRYAVRARNSNGASAFVHVDIDTTPTISGAPSAAKNASGDIVVTRPALITAVMGDGIVGSPGAWQVRDNGGAVLDTLPASQTEWVHSSPSPTVSHTYQVRAATANPVLSSSWSLSSNTVQLITPPLAPTNLGPTVADATEPITLAWTHNSVDTTPQEASQVRYRPEGSEGPWTTMTVVGSPLQQRVLPAGFWANGTNQEWQVHTRGAHADFSAWSTTRVTVLNNRPVTGVTIPGPTHNSDRLTVAWSFHDPEATSQSRWQVVLLDDAGDHVETRAGFGTVGSATMRTSLPDGSTWSVEVTTWDGSGLASAPAAQEFTVDWAEPPTPTGDAQWHRHEGYVTVTVDAPSPAGAEVAVDHLQVWRSHGAGWVLVADGLGHGQSVTDMIPPAGGVAVYRVAAVSALPSTAWSADIAVETTTQWVFLNYGPGFSQVVRLWGNMSASRAAGRAKTLHQFADRPDPVERGGTARKREYTLTARLFAPYLPPDRTSSWEELEALADASAPVLLRDPLGVRMACSVGEIPETDHLKIHQSVTIPLTRVDWAEESTDGGPVAGGGGTR